MSSILVVAAAELLSLHLSRGCDRPRVDGVGEKHWRHDVRRLLAEASNHVGQARFDRLSERSLLIRRQTEPDLVANVG